MHNHRHSARELYLLWVRNPVWSWNNDFIAIIDEDLKNVVQAVLATAGDDDFGRSKCQATVTLKFVDNGILQGRDPCTGRVLCIALCKRIDGSSFNVIRRVKVRLTSTKSDDINAIGFHLIRLCGDGESWRWSAGLRAAG